MSYIHSLDFPRHAVSSEQSLQMPLSRKLIITGRHLAMLHRWARDLSKGSGCRVIILQQHTGEWSAILNVNETTSEHELEVAIENVVLSLPLSELTSIEPFQLMPIGSNEGGPHNLFGRLPKWDLSFVCVVPTNRRLDPQMFQALAESLWKNEDYQEDISQLQTQKQAFVQQITRDFEELHWLRAVSQRMGRAILHDGILELAQEQLPRLRKIIEAEYVGFIPIGALDRSSEMELWHVPGAGKLPVTSDELVRFVQVCDRESDSQTSVFNIQSNLKVFHDCKRIRNCILAKLEKHSKVFGYLIAINKEVELVCDSPEEFLLVDPNGFQFGTFEAGLVTSFATILSSHAVNAELFGEQERLLTGIVRAVINAIDAKDQYTCGHSDRVAEYARAIAKQMGLPSKDCDRIYLSGLLHDVGKIGIPDSILSKPDRLTEEEYAIIKLHPEIGYEILKHLKPLEYVLPGVLHHHEAVNGKGYPHGLVGEQIPLAGRVIAVADAYDAMTSDRPYRKGMPSEKAEAILCKEAGSTWDELAVFAIMECIQQGAIGPKSGSMDSRFSSESHAALDRLRGVRVLAESW